MDINFTRRMAGYAPLALISMFLAEPAVGDSISVSRSICATISEENCTINARRRTIAIVKNDLKGKKNAKAVAKLIGRPICNRIVNTFIFTPLRPRLNDWQMTLQDRRHGNPLYACMLF